MILRIGSKSFTLIELMVTLTILAVGLVLILQAFSSLVKYTGLSQDITEACVLAENQLSELEIKIYRGVNIPLQERRESGRLSWNYNIKNLEDLGLLQIHLKVLDKREKEILEITTYLRSL